jgi:hypothetical protein
MRAIAAILLTALALTACSGDPAPVGNPPNTAIDTSTAPAAPTHLAWGKTATVSGHGGNPLRITPVGVLYDKGPYKGVNGPENGWFVAIAVRVEAVERQDSPAAPAGSGGFSWRGAEQTIDGIEGNASSSPWVGAVNGFGIDSPIEPGSPEVGIETFDVPSKGGRLIYVSPVDQAITSWELPTADTGTGLDKVKQRIRDFS